MATDSVTVVRIYVREGEHATAKIMALLLRAKVAGATVFRGSAGFGPDGALHTSSLMSLSLDLPERAQEGVGVTKFNYGGQAVLEGVMMRGEKDWAVCVRNPAGDIVVHREALPGAVYRSRVFKWPFLRGLTMLWDSMQCSMCCIRRLVSGSRDMSLGRLHLA